jgi:hypothetical protein
MSAVLICGSVDVRGRGSRRPFTGRAPSAEAAGGYARSGEVVMSERWLRYRVAEGMPTKRFGARLRFDVEEVQNWIEERYGPKT